MPPFDPFSMQNPQGAQPAPPQMTPQQAQQTFAVPTGQPVQAPVAPAAPATPAQPTAQETAQANQPATAPTPKNPNSTQSSLQFSEIRDGMIIMLDGSFRAVIACKSINFDLMSDAEREGVEYSYQNFLNSLNFPVQILIRSQRVDIGPYIEKLVTIRRSQDNMLLGVLMDDYINFIDMLAQEANIMEKTFYVVVPYFPGGDVANLVEQGKGFFGKLFARPKNTITKINSADYQKAKDEIQNRVSTVMSGLFQIGVQSVQLDTKSVGELLYNVYNPDTALRQPLGDFSQTATTFVRKGEGPAPKPEGIF